MPLYFNHSSRASPSSSSKYASSSDRWYPKYEAQSSSSSSRYYSDDTRTSSRHVSSSHTTYPVRSISPPRSRAEEPRYDTRSYADHRSVSPLGSSRFEFSLASSSYNGTLNRSSTVREPSRPKPRHADRAATYAYDRPSTSRSTQSLGGSGLRRNNAIYGRAAERSSGKMAWSDERTPAQDRITTKRYPVMENRFTGQGRPGDWEQY